MDAAFSVNILEWHLIGQAQAFHGSIPYGSPKLGWIKL